MAQSILGISSNPIVVILIINLILVFVGMFMESTAAVVIMFPVLLPVATAIGMAPVHFGVMAILNLMIGLVTPPVGIVIYVASQVGKVPVTQSLKANMPFLVGLFLVLLMVSYIPALTTWMPAVLAH